MSINSTLRREGIEIVNPLNTLEINKIASKIAEKLKKGAAARAKKKGKKIDDNLSLYEYYISILAVGENKDWNQLLEYTVPQLTDEFKRFQRKNEFDAYRQAIMAGAQNLEEFVIGWLTTIKSHNYCYGFI